MAAGGAQSRSLEKGKHMVCALRKVYAAVKSTAGRWKSSLCFASVRSHAGKLDRSLYVHHIRRKTRKILEGDEGEKEKKTQEEERRARDEENRKRRKRG